MPPIGFETLPLGTAGFANRRASWLQSDLARRSVFSLEGAEMSTTQRQNAAKLRREKAKAQSASPKKHIPVSEEGFAALQAEYDQLTKVKRKEISGVVQRAREEGDLRENAGYHAAREEQGMVEARIRELEYLIKHAVVTDEPIIDASVVRVGSMVTLELDGDEVTYTIVGALEAQPRQGKI